MKREANKSKGKAGKFFEQRLIAGQTKVPVKWKLYQRKHLKKGKRGRRNYPWRKKHKV